MKSLLLVLLVPLAGACTTVDRDLGDHADPVFGAPRWALAFASDGRGEATGVRFDSHGDVLVAGWSATPVDFGSGPIANPVYLTKRAAADGAELWTRTFPSLAGIDHLAVSADDSITAVAPPGLVHLSPAGEILWSLAPMGDLPTNVSSLVPGPIDHTWYVGGSTTTTGGEVDAFLALVGADGTTTWSHTWGGADVQTITAIALASNGDAVVRLVDHSDQLAAVTSTNAVAWTRDLAGHNGEFLGGLPDGRIADLADTAPDFRLQLVIDDNNGSPTMQSPVIGGQLGAGMVDAAGRVIFGAHLSPRFAGTDLSRRAYLGAYAPDGTALSAREIQVGGTGQCDPVISIDAAPTGAIAATVIVTGAVDFGTGIRPNPGAWSGAVVVYNAPEAP